MTSLLGGGENSPPATTRFFGDVMLKLKVGPQAATVNGSHYRTGSAVWRGLKMSEAEPRAQSAMMVAVCGADRAPIDIHLQSPFRDHDDDGLDATVFYRVRPKMEAGKKWKGRMVDFVCFEKIDGEWWIAVKLGDNNAR